MSWYKTGTINVTKGSNIVTGIGTKWANQLSGVSAGRMLILQSSNQIEIYEIASVQSDTQLTLADDYGGESKTGVIYQIPTSPTVSIESLALRISEMLNYYQTQLNAWQTILTGDGKVTLTAPDGSVVTIISQYSIQQELIKLIEESKVYVSESAKNASNAQKASTSATDSANAAKTSADSANKSATAASVSAKNASDSANSIKTSETIAKTSANEAAKSASDAKQWASTVDTSTFVKKNGDTVTGQLTLKYKACGIKFNYENPDNVTVIRPIGDNFSFLFYDAEKKNWFTKLRYAKDGNAWKFDNIDDVTINGKSALKVGDYGIGGQKGATVNNFDERLAGGFYQCRTSNFPNLPFNGGDCTATLLAYPSNSSYWKVEQLAVVNSKTPRIYYRTDSKDDGKQNWYEVITTANASADIVGALPAVKTFVNDTPTYMVGSHIVFKDAIGDQRLMPFRRDELPFGWYFRNGDNYLLSSPQGQVLNGLSINYKNDHRITIKTINGQQYINVPTAFSADGRGFFERAADGASRQVGSVEDDAIREIWGHFDSGVVDNHTLYTRGAFQGTNAIYPQNGAFEPKKDWWAWGYDFYASRVVPTANENRPLNIGMTPVIYLGV